MFKKIQIENFQMIEKAELNFGKFTAICGLSDTGKSCVYRALSYAVELPRGNSYIRVGAPHCRVVLYLENGDVYEWKKVRNLAHYVKFTTAAGEVYEFNRVDKLPDVISSLLLLKPVAISEDEKLSVNFLHQFSAPFLISPDYSASYVARVLGKMGGLDVVLKGMRECARDMQRQTQALDMVSEKLSSLEEKFKVVNAWNLDKLGSELHNLEERVKLLKAKFLEFRKVHDVKEKCLRIRSDIDKFKDLKVVAPLVKGVLTKCVNYKAAVNFYADSSDKLFALKEKVKKLSVLPQVLEHRDLLKTLREAYSLVRDRVLAQIDLKNKVGVVAVSFDSVSKLTNEYNDCVRKRDDVMSAYNVFIKENDVCPLCKRPGLSEALKR